VVVTEGYTRHGSADQEAATYMVVQPARVGNRHEDESGAEGT